MKSVKLIVAYPQPTDASAFEKVYAQEHVPMAIANLHGKTKIVATKVMASPQGEPRFYLIAKSAFPIHGGAPKVRAIGRRPANLGQRDEDLVGRAPGHLDRGRGHVHVLTIEAVHGKIDEAKFVRTLPITALFFSGDFKNAFPILESDFGGAVVEGNIDIELAIPSGDACELLTRLSVAGYFRRVPQDRN